MMSRMEFQILINHIIKNFDAVGLGSGTNNKNLLSRIDT